MGQLAEADDGDMAQHVSSDSDDDFHSVKSPHGPASPAEGDDNDDDDSASMVDMAPPVHPLPAFQRAFEESILEAAEGRFPSPSASDPDEIECDAERRRRRLLAAEHYEHVSVAQWKQRPGAEYHPFVKLMAQLVFGMHLLQQEQAKSNEAVVKILQNHVNDVDSFLERTSDDFDLAITDIEERIRYLQLPMQHMDIFEVMLDEKKFRTDLLHGNEKIEKIIRRTGEAMQDAMVDIQSGLSCTRELHEYLATIEKSGSIENPDVAEVFSAMRGNQQGWMKFLSDLQTKGINLGNELATLGNVVAEIARLAGEASRRNKPHYQSRSASVSQQSGKRASALQSKYTPGPITHQNHSALLDKPLPREPSRPRNTPEIAMPKPHPVPFSKRFEQPRDRAPTPGSRSTSSPMTRSSVPPRPRTSSSADPRTMRADNGTRMPDYRSDHRKHSNPLRSHPPDGDIPVLLQSPTFSQKPGRTQSQSAGDVLNTTTKGPSPLFRRSKSSDNVTAPVSAAPATPSSKKTVGVEKRKESTKINLVPKRDTTGDSLPSVKTGFSRRLSMKLKQLPVPIKTYPKPNDQPLQTTPKPIDSAYSPDRDRNRSTSSPTNLTSDTDQTAVETPNPPESEKQPQQSALPIPIIPSKEKEPPIPKQSETENSEFQKYSLVRDGSRLALFPKVDNDTPSPPQHQITPSPKVIEAWGAGFQADYSPPKPRMHTANKASRTFSMSKFFSSHRRGESRSVTS